MASLYELIGQYRLLMDIMEDSDSDEQVIIDTLGAVEGEIEVKAENYVKVIISLQANYEALMGEADRFAARAAVFDSRIKRMKSALMQAMQATGSTKISTDLFEIKIVSNGGVRPLIIDGTVPNDYVKLMPQNDNKHIRQHLEELEKAGLACNWAHLGDRGTHLQIK